MADTIQQDAVRFLTEQHQQVRELFEAVASQKGEARKEAFEPLVRLLAVHETAEEMVIYPTVRGIGDEANDIVEARLQEEDSAKKMLTDLEKMELGSAEFEELFTKVRAAVETHAENEEREIFPLLEQTTNQAQLEQMTAALKTAEGMAPTHPHKTAPTSATGNLLVGPFVAMVDRVRDALRK